MDSDSESPEKRTITTRDLRVSQFLEAWKDIRYGALVPLKDDIDPGRIPRLLSHVWLFQYDPSKSDFICQLSGEDVNIAWGRKIKGRPLRDIVTGERYSHVLQRWRNVIDTPLIEHSTVQEHPHTKVGYQTERLILPLASNSELRDYVFGISLYTISSSNRDPHARTATGDITTTIPCIEV